MPRKTKEKIVEKLVNYIKEDRPRKFRDYVRKHEVDLKNTLLPKGRTFLHCAAKHGRGTFTSYLLKHNVLPLQADSKGGLPIHMAINRALRLPPKEAAEVYRNVVIPLLKEYPAPARFCEGYGDNLYSMLADLNQHIREDDTSSDSDTDSSDWESSDSETPENSQQDWGERLAREFENESADFYGRYDCYDDFQQEHQKETFRNWSEHMESEMRQRRYQQSFNNPSNSSQNNKRKHTSSRHAGTQTKPPKTSTGIDAKEAIRHAKAKQNLEKLRQTYEERFQAALEDKSEGQLSYGDIPWPSKGSLDQVMEVLFGDKADWTVSALKKFTREQRVRWHPDKFLQKFIDKIAPKSFERVMDRVKEISQALNRKAESLASG